MDVGYTYSYIYKMKVVKSIDRSREIAAVINNAPVQSNKPLKRVTGSNSYVLTRNIETELDNF